MQSKSIRKYVKCCPRKVKKLHGSVWTFCYSLICLRSLHSETLIMVVIANLGILLQYHSALPSNSLDYFLYTDELVEMNPHQRVNHAHVTTLQRKRSTITYNENHLGEQSTWTTIWRSEMYTFCAVTDCVCVNRFCKILTSLNGALLSNEFSVTADWLTSTACIPFRDNASITLWCPEEKYKKSL